MYPHASRLCRLISVNISGLSYIKTLLWRSKHPENNYERFLFTFWHPEPTITLRNLVKKTFFCILLCSKLGINVVLLNNAHLCYVSLWTIIIFACKSQLPPGNLSCSGWKRVHLGGLIKTNIVSVYLKYVCIYWIPFQMHRWISLCNMIQNNDLNYRNMFISILPKNSIQNDIKKFDFVFNA